MLKNNKKKEGFILPLFPKDNRKDLICDLSFKNTKKGAGFTLIELMVVVLVVSIGMVGVMNLIMRIFLYTRLNQAKLTASFLAQEGIEIVRNIRDTNWIEGADWDDNLDGGYHGADYQTTELSDPRCNPNVPLKFDGNFYSCVGAENTKFKRGITIQKGTDEITVQVSVTWEDYEVKAIEKIYNWRQP
jgi:prepilin-type N-terminal cleavage/methylation domain-containing protein